MKALLAVYDKTDLDYIGRELHDLGYELLATGGTFKRLQESGIPVSSVSDFTGHMELLGGRVKTLHPKIHAGILNRRDNHQDADEMSNAGYESIDIVICNLYPFQETVSANKNILIDEAVEQIDIGGPTMLRASAKNFKYVLSISNPKFYKQVIDELKNAKNKIDNISFDFKKKLAQETFLHTAQYDSLVSEFFENKEKVFPDKKVITLNKVQDLRYGENPHQLGAFYNIDSVNQTINDNIGPIQHHGKAMSYVNILDADAAFKLVCDFEEPAVAIIKHTNACCFAAGSEPMSSLYSAALDNGDAVSAFGGIVAVNRIIDKEFAETLRKKLSPINESKMFFEIIIAPEISSDGLEHLKKKSKDLRILTMNKYDWQSSSKDYVSVQGGFLSQTIDYAEANFDLISGKELNSNQLKDLKIAWKVVKHIKSNAITIVKNGLLIGMGAGQPNRVESAKLAILQAGENVTSGLLASDAFFPFPDSVELAAKAGIDGIVQPGGSIRDEATIQTVKKYGISLYHTGIRHFRH